jgi:predicted nucleic acid-binding protein
VIAFLDASALIYLLEGRAPFAARVREQLAELSRQHSDLRLSIGRLSWLECRVGPMKSNDSALLNAYDQFFTLPDLIWIELSRDVVELAAAIRVRHGLRTPDALQAASCLQLGSDHQMLTGDLGFARVLGLNVSCVAEGD